MFVCVLCVPMWFSSVVSIFLRLPGVSLWTKLYVRKHKLCYARIVHNVTISMEQIHIFKTNAIAELTL